MRRARYKIVRQVNCDDWELWVIDEDGYWHLYGTYLSNQGAIKAMKKIIKGSVVNASLYDADGERINIKH